MYTRESTRRTLALLLIYGVLSVPSYTLRADETYTGGTVVPQTTIRFNSETWHTAPHPKVASFTILTDGSAHGLLETGVPFYQENIPNTYNIRVQRFSIQDHFHYIIEGREVYTFEALSIELARAYNEKSTIQQA